MNSEGVRKACSHFFCLRISGEDDNERGRGFFQVRDGGIGHPGFG